MQYSNGDAYEGSWVKDCRHGSAKFLYASGDVFVGTFDNNRREGLGTIYMVSFRAAQGNSVQSAAACGLLQIQMLDLRLALLVQARNGQKHTAEYRADKPMCGTWAEIDGTACKIAGSFSSAFLLPLLC